MGADGVDLQLVAFQQVALCRAVAVFGQRPLHVEVIAPAGQFQAVVAKLGRLAGQVLQGKIGPLTGKQRERASHAKLLRSAGCQSAGTASRSLGRAFRAPSHCAASADRLQRCPSLRASCRPAGKIRRLLAARRTPTALQPLLFSGQSLRFFHSRAKAAFFAMTSSPRPFSVGRPVRIGIIGAGAVSDYHHVPGIRLDPRAKLVAACDTSAELLEQRRGQWGIDRVTTDPEVLCADPNVDAVIIATPNFTHRPIVLAAARGGKHVMCEKPLGL